MSENSLKKILILAANPKNTTPLRLDQEVREIDEGLTRAKQRDRFELEQKWAVRPRDVQRAILDLSPHQIECVLLNACHSEVQAKAIAQYATSPAKANVLRLRTKP
jgi:hypothetical protein